MSIKGNRSFVVPAEMVELRAENEKRTLVGVAVAYGKETQLWEGLFERFAPGAFKEFLSEKQDVRALFNHNPDYLLGRMKNDTLRLSDDERGLRFEIDLPDTQLGRDMENMVKRGDIDGMSFGFRAKEERFIRISDKKSLREVVKAKLLDVSPVTYPAYSQTRVTVRSARDIAQEVHAEEMEVSRLVSAIEDMRELSTEQRSLSEKIYEALRKEFELLVPPPAGPGLSNIKLRQALREKQFV